MTADQLRQQIELKVVELIKYSIAAGTMTEARGQAMSQWVLQVLRPEMTFEEIYKAIPKLDDQFPELAQLVVPLLKQYEEGVVKQAQQKVEEYIREGKYDAATKLAQDAASQNLKLKWSGQAKPENQKVQNPAQNTKQTNQTPQNPK